MSLLDRLCGHTLGQPYQPPVVRNAPRLPADYLKTIVDTIDNQHEVRRIGEAHAISHADYTHVSSLVGICTRMHVLAANDDRVHYSRTTGGHRVMWAFGRAVEHHIRSQYLIGTRNRFAYGVWECVCGDFRHVGYVPAGQCGRCQHPAHTYKELTLFDHERKLKGNPDLISVYDHEWFFPTEIKSMNKEEWGKLSAPKGDHILQVGVYHRMMEALGYKVLPQAVIMYASKDFKHGSPYKEYHIDTDSAAVRSIVDTALGYAAAIANAKTTGQLPERTICSRHSDTRAKDCPMLVQCFSRD